MLDEFGFETDNQSIKNEYTNLLKYVKKLEQKIIDIGNNNLEKYNELSSKNSNIETKYTNSLNYITHLEQKIIELNNNNLEKYNELNNKIINLENDQKYNFEHFSNHNTSEIDRIVKLEDNQKYIINKVLYLNNDTTKEIFTNSNTYNEFFQDKKTKYIYLHRYRDNNNTEFDTGNHHNVINIRSLHIYDNNNNRIMVKNILIDGKISNCTDRFNNFIDDNINGSFLIHDNYINIVFELESECIINKLVLYNRNDMCQKRIDGCGFVFKDSLDSIIYKTNVINTNLCFNEFTFNFTEKNPHILHKVD